MDSAALRINAEDRAIGLPTLTPSGSTHDRWRYPPMRFFGIPVLEILALILVVTAPALSADPAPVEFDPYVHLEGFEEAAFGDYARLYKLKPFENMEGENLGKTELNAQREAWAAERKRVAALIRRIEADPMSKALFELDGRLERSSRFEDFTYTRFTKDAPLVLYVKRPEKTPPGHGDEVAKKLLPRLKAVKARFDAHFAGPHTLKPREGYELFAVVVLETRKEFIDVLATGSFREQITAGSWYDPSIRAVVTYRDVLKHATLQGLSVTDLIAHNMALALFLHHAARPEALEGTPWLLKGLAEITAAPGAGGADPAIPPMPEGYFRVLGRNLKKPLWRDAVFLRTEDLLARRSMRDHHDWVLGRFGKAKKSKDWYWESLSVFISESGVFCRFLMEGEGGRHRKSFEKLTGLVLGGKMGREVFREAFGKADPLLLHRGFIAWLDHLISTRAPDLALSDADRIALAAPTLAVDDEENKDGKEPAKVARSGKDPSGPGRKATAPSSARKTRSLKPSWPDPGFRPVSLRPDALSLEDWLALALYEARDGRINASRKRLERLLKTAGTTDPDVTDRMARELERLGALERLRNAFLDYLARKKTRLRLELDGEKITGEVEALDESRKTFTLAPLRDEPMTRPLDDFRLADCSRLIQEKRYTVREEWVKGYMNLLLKNGKGRYRAKTGDRQSRLLAEDQSSYGKLLERGRILYTLDVLSSQSLPKTIAEAERIERRIRELLLLGEKVPALMPYMPRLEAFAAHALVLRYDAKPLEERLHIEGDLKVRPDGLIEVEYRFDRSGMIADFPRSEHLESRRKWVTDIRVDTHDPSIRIDDGALVLQGETCTRLGFGLKAPFEISCEVLYKEMEDDSFADFNPPSYFALSICDDSEGNGILCYAGGSIVARHIKLGFTDAKILGWTKRFDTRYHLIMAHDGRQVEVIRDDESQNVMPCGPLKSGGLALFTHSAREVHVKRLHCIGALDETCLADRRKAWIRAEIDGWKKGRSGRKR